MFWGHKKQSFFEFTHWEMLKSLYFHRVPWCGKVVLLQPMEHSKIEIMVDRMGSVTRESALLVWIFHRKNWNIFTQCHLTYLATEHAQCWCWQTWHNPSGSQFPVKMNCSAMSFVIKKCLPPIQHLTTPMCTKQTNQTALQATFWWDNLVSQFAGRI